jgi:hypothetical protein
VLKRGWDVVCDVIGGLHLAPASLWFLIGSHPSVKCGLPVVQLELELELELEFEVLLFSKMARDGGGWLMAAAPALA